MLWIYMPYKINILTIAVPNTVSLAIKVTQRSSRVLLYKIVFLFT